MGKKVLAALLILVLLAGVVYVSVSIWISVSVKRIVDYANREEDCYPLVADQISAELFHRLNHGRSVRGPSNTRMAEYPNNAHEVFTRTFPISTHNFSTATSVYLYTYSYESYNEEGEKWHSGAWDVPITITLVREGWKWIVVGTHEEL